MSTNPGFANCLCGLAAGEHRPNRVLKLDKLLFEALDKFRSRPGKYT
jgi:hypothetical protein